MRSFVYLGSTIDSELLLEPLLRNVGRQVDQKLFVLRKVRRYITESAAKPMQKQMILPMFDYNGFLLLSCTLDQKRELQRRQNDAIHTGLLYTRRGSIGKWDWLAWNNVEIYKFSNYCMCELRIVFLY